MIELTHESILVPLIIFCRVGACFMVLPGFSSDRIPVQLRLFVAIAIALALISLPAIPLFSSGNRLLWWCGLLLVILCGVILMAGVISLVVRRLHDLGLAGYHAIWVIPPLFIQSEGREAYLAIPLIALSAWLTFWPGQKAPNRFGA